MKLQFTGTLQGAATIKLDDDNSGVIRITFSGDQWANVARLTMYQRKPLKVTIEEEK